MAKTQSCADEATFRRAGPADVAAVRRLVRSAYAKWVPVIGREPMPMTADYERAVGDHVIDLMVVNGEIVGLIELVPEPDCLLIENVAVEPSEWGKGYGRALMSHAVDAAKLLRRKRIRLYTNKLMVQNIALYQRLGYRIDKEERTPDGRDAVHMSTAIGHDSGR
jgi:GNAT superfamily N-acetyltransferase